MFFVVFVVHVLRLLLNVSTFWWHIINDMRSKALSICCWMAQWKVHTTFVTAIRCLRFDWRPIWIVLAVPARLLISIILRICLQQSWKMLRRWIWVGFGHHVDSEASHSSLCLWEWHHRIRQFDFELIMSQRSLLKKLLRPKCICCQESKHSWCLPMNRILRLPHVLQTARSCSKVVENIDTRTHIQVLIRYHWSGNIAMMFGNSRRTGKRCWNVRDKHLLLQVNKPYSHHFMTINFRSSCNPFSARTSRVTQKFFWVQFVCSFDQENAVQTIDVPQLHAWLHGPEPWISNNRATGTLCK